jgi:hypothetical protein
MGRPPLSIYAGIDVAAQGLCQVRLANFSCRRSGGRAVGQSNVRFVL